MDKGEYESAIEDYTAVISSNAHKTHHIATALGNRGLAKCLLGNYEDALKDINQALTFYPNDPKFLNDRAMLYRLLNLNNNATYDIEHARQFETNLYTDSTKPMLSAAYDTYATREMKKKQPNLKAAFLYLNESIRLDYSTSKRARLFAILCKMDEKDKPEVIAWLNPAFLCDFQGNKKFASGDYKGAIEDYTESLRLEPNNGHALYHRGLAKAALGEDFESALEDFDAVMMMVDPYHVWAYAVREMVQRHFKEALRWSNEAMRFWWNVEDGKAEFIKLLNLKAMGSGKKIITEVGESSGDMVCWAKAFGYSALVELMMNAGAVDNEFLQPRASLIDCIKANDQEKFKRMLSPSTLQKVDKEYHANAFYWIAYYGHSHFLDLIKAAGFDMNAEDSYGKTPLLVAAETGYTRVIDFCVKAGADVNKLTSYGMTPLMVAIDHSNEDVVVALLKAKANPTLPTPFGTALALAKHYNEASMVSLLEAHLNKCSTKKIAQALELKSESQTVNLTEAIKSNNQKELLRMINNIKAGIDDKKILNEADKDGETPVFIAAKMGHAEIVTILHQAGAAIDMPNKYDMSPVWIAACHGHTDVIMALKAAGASMDTRTNDDASPVSMAACMGHATAITTLKAQGANVNTPNSDGQTPIYLAAQYQHASAINALALAEANANTPDKDGITPLFVAIQNSTSVDPIIALLHAKADPSMATPKGTPLTLAQSIQGPKGQDIIRLLQEHIKQHAISRTSDKKEDQVKLKDILEEIRTFFLENKNVGEKTEKYTAYNDALKQIDPNMQLIYMKKQKQHVLFINDEEVENPVQEIDKIINALAQPSEKSSVLLHL